MVEINQYKMYFLKMKPQYYQLIHVIVMVEWKTNLMIIRIVKDSRYIQVKLQLIIIDTSLLRERRIVILKEN